jgi:hypothetical protein
MLYPHVGEVGEAEADAATCIHSNLVSSHHDQQVSQNSNQRQGGLQQDTTTSARTQEGPREGFPLLAVGVSSAPMRLSAEATAAMEDSDDGGSALLLNDASSSDGLGGSARRGRSKRRSSRTSKKRKVEHGSGLPGSELAEADHEDENASREGPRRRGEPNSKYVAWTKQVGLRGEARDA